MKRVVGAGKGGAKTQAEYEQEFLAKGDTPGMAKYKAERAAILAPQEEATQAKLRADWQAETQGKVPYETWLKDRQVKGLIAKRGEKSARRGVQKEMQQEAAKSAEAAKQAYNEEMRRRESSIFTPIVQGLTKVGDLAAKSGLLPPIVSEVYKATAPPGSEFAGSGKSKKWIQKAVEGMKEGAFTQQALRAHKTPADFAKQVLAHPEHFTERTRKRAQFLVNISGGGRMTVNQLKRQWEIVKNYYEGQIADLEDELDMLASDEELVGSELYQQTEAKLAKLKAGQEKSFNRQERDIAKRKRGGGPFEVATHVKDLEGIIRRLEATTDPEAKKRIHKQLTRVIARIEPETDLLGPSETEHLKSLISRGLATYPADKRAMAAEVLPVMQGDIDRFQEEIRQIAREREAKGLAQLDKDIAKKRGRGKIQMTKSQFVKEHTKLINLLEKAGKEGKEQKKELAKVLKGGRVPDKKTEKAEDLTELEKVGIELEEAYDELEAITTTMENTIEAQGGQGMVQAYPKVVKKLEKLDDRKRELEVKIAKLEERQNELTQSPMPITGEGVTASKAKVAPEPKFPPPGSLAQPTPVIYERPATGRYGKRKERARQEEEFLAHQGFDTRRIAPDVREKMLRNLKVIPIGSKEHPGVSNLPERGTLVSREK